MSKEPLFVRYEPVFEKTAGIEVPMPEDPSQWERAVLDKAFETIPSLGKYMVKVNMVASDASKGHAYGVLEVSTEPPLPPSAPGLADKRPKETEPLKKVTLPFVVRKRKLLPLDIVMVNEIPVYLTGDELDRLMFSPTTFSTPAKSPQTKDLTDHFSVPEVRSGSAMGMQAKMSSDSILVKLSRVGFKREHLDEFKKQANHPGLLSKVGRAKLSDNFLLPMVSHSLEKTAADQLMGEEPPPNAVHVGRRGNVFNVYYGNTHAFEMKELHLTPKEAAEKFGEEVLKLADGQSITEVPGRVEQSMLPGDSFGSPEEPGIYNIKTTTGHLISGALFPKVASFEGRTLPLAIFSNGTQFGVQEKISAQQVGPLKDIPSGSPSGEGFFLLPDGTALEPIDIKASVRGADGTTGYMVNRYLGEGAKVSSVPGLRAVVRTADSAFSIPGDSKWIPLSGEKLSVLGDPETASIKLSSERLASSFTIRRGAYDGYEFEGPAVSHMGGKVEMNKDAAEFMGGVLGVGPETMQAALKAADQGVAPVELQGNPPTMLKDLQQAAEKTASEAINYGAAKLEPLRKMLVKEAAAIADANTVDEVLSLGFLTPENVSLYLETLPDLMTAESRLARLLLASRVGLKQLPEDALEVALKAMHRVVEGLRALSATHGDRR